MKDIQGMPGTRGGLALRLSQFAFAVVALCIMASTSDFPSVTAFRCLVAAAGLQSLWSLSLAIIDIYAILVRRSLRNFRVVSIFAMGDGVYIEQCYGKFSANPSNYEFSYAMQEYVFGIRMKESKPWKCVNHLLIPLNKLNAHWLLGHVDLKERHMTVYDSDKPGNRNRGETYFKKLCIMLSYLLRSASFYEQRKNLVDFVDEFTCELSQNSPQQHNGGDCGMFALKSMEFLHARLPLTFTQDDIEFFRRKYAYEVFNKELSI